MLTSSPMSLFSSLFGTRLLPVSKVEKAAVGETNMWADGQEASGQTHTRRTQTQTHPVLATHLVLG